MPEPEKQVRGTFQFTVTEDGNLADLSTNVVALQKLWLDRSMFKDDDIGPGNPGDFDNGAWHASCHMAGGGGVRRAADGKILWLEISHLPSKDEYFASVTARTGAAPQTIPIHSAEGQKLLAGSTLLGFVEGNSTGRISARGVNDSSELFNLWRRQDFDNPVDSPADGGKVWEHWCTLRDIRPTARIGMSVLTAYAALAAALSDRFAATVIRGRRDYGHPRQLVALVRGGFVSETAATWDANPVVLPSPAERLLLAAQPELALEAAEKLDWSNPPRYYMFSRRIRSWSSAADVRRDLQTP